VDREDALLALDDGVPCGAGRRSDPLGSNDPRSRSPAPVHARKPLTGRGALRKRQDR
jgi:hypothetical protein